MHYDRTDGGRFSAIFSGRHSPRRALFLKAF